MVDSKAQEHRSSMKTLVTTRREAYAAVRAGPIIVTMTDDAAAIIETEDTQSLVGHPGIPYVPLASFYVLWFILIDHAECPNQTAL